METKKKSIYHIESEYLDLMSQIESLDGEITPEIEEQMKINEGDLQSKSIAYLSVIKDKESKISQIDDEIKRLQSIKKSDLNTIEKMKGSLLDAVKIFGAYESGFTKFGIRKSKQLNILDSKKVPEMFKSQIITEKIDKTAIKKALSLVDGTEIDGVELIECQNLKIN